MHMLKRHIEEVQEVELDADGYDDLGHYYGTGDRLYQVFFTVDDRFQADGKTLLMHETFVRAHGLEDAAAKVKEYGHEAEARSPDQIEK